MKRPCEDGSSAESAAEETIDVGSESAYPGHMKASFLRCGSPTTATQVMARKKRRGVKLLFALIKAHSVSCPRSYGFGDGLRSSFAPFICQIIEKRRRDRINNSLLELRRLVPTAFEKQGSAKLEKAEILQMTVDHLKVLQATGGKGYFDAHALALDFLSLGFRECVTEVSRYLSAVEGLDPSDPQHVRLLTHLASCASRRDATALTMTSHSPHHHHQQPHALPHPFHPHHWAAAVAAFRPLPAAAVAPYRLSRLPVCAEAGGGGGAPQRLAELSQRSVASSFSSYADSTSSSSSSSLVLPCTPTPLSASLLSLSASFPITLHGGLPILPPSSFTAATATATSPPVSSSSSQTPPSSSSKPYRPWGTEVGAF